MKKYAEQIAAFEAKRGTIVAANEAIMEKALADGATLDAAQKEEFDNNQADIAEIDDHLKRLKSFEKDAVATATEISGVRTVETGAAARSSAVVKTQPKLAPGIGFARIAKCLGIAKGVLGDAMLVAKNRYGEDSIVVGHIKTAVEGGSTLSGNWSSELVGQETSAYADFVEWLRPQTILGKFGLNGIPALRVVPFRVPLITQTAGGSGYWVGEGKSIPLTQANFTRTHLEPLKVGNIAVLTEEVIRDSSPAADAIIRDELGKALMSRLDTDFMDPSKAVSAGVSPASITHGAEAIASSGTDSDAVRLDVRSVMRKFTDADNPPSTGVWVMSTGNALALAMMVNELGQPEFPGITMQGGTFAGLPVIVSDYIGSVVALVNASDIYFADDGGVEIDFSRETSLVMADTSTMDVNTPTPSQLVSMFQTGSVAFRALRSLNWASRRASAVAYLTAVVWGGAVHAS